ncbi:dUTP diphosphatase, partial [Lysinibacillus halotolerans]
HFILSIGLELDVRPNLDWDDICHYDDDITNLFLDFNIKIQDLRHWESDDSWIELFEDFYILGKMLGFTWDQIEQAYFEKNQINHQRQNHGY